MKTSVRKEWNRIATYGHWVALEHVTQIGTYAIGDTRTGVVFLKNNRSHAVLEAQKKHKAEGGIISPARNVV